MALACGVRASGDIGNLFQFGTVSAAGCSAVATLDLNLFRAASPA
jgi:hypothetical protein